MPKYPSSSPADRNLEECQSTHSPLLLREIYKNAKVPTVLLLREIYKNAKVPTVLLLREIYKNAKVPTVLLLRTSECQSSHRPPS